MYELLFLMVMSPYICIFGIIIPTITTGVSYGVLTVVTDLFKKEFSKEKIKLFLIITFILTFIISCGSFIYAFKDHTIMLD